MKARACACLLVKIQEAQQQLAATLEGEKAPNPLECLAACLPFSSPRSSPHESLSLVILPCLKAVRVRLSTRVDVRSHSSRIRFRKKANLSIILVFGEYFLPVLQLCVHLITGLNLLQSVHVKVFCKPFFNPLLLLVG